MWAITLPPQNGGGTDRHGRLPHAEGALRRLPYAAERGQPLQHHPAYAGQIGHIHVADAPGRHEPGTGEINYANVFACLEEAGYTGLIGYELFPKTTTAEAVKAIMAV